MTRPCYVGVDVGGTKIAAAPVGSGGLLAARQLWPTPARDGPAAILAAISRAVHSVIEALPGDVEIAGVGVGTGGVIDHPGGRVVSANELLAGWAGTAVRDDLRQRLGTRIEVDNDVNVFGLGEHLFGAGQGLRDVLYVSVGTGVGGALVLGDELRRGAHHSAGEIGHWPLPHAAAKRCNCGRLGHVEAVAAGPAIVERYQQATGESAAGDVRVVAKRAAAGHEVAASVLADAATALGHALAGLVNAVDPEAVVVGGGVSEAGAAYWGPLEETLRAQALPGPSRCGLHPAALRGDAAVVGAAALLMPRLPGERVCGTWRTEGDDG